MEKEAGDSTLSKDARSKVFVPIVRAASWRPSSEKDGLFHHVASHGGFGFRPEDEARLDLLQSRLGVLTGLRILEPGCGAGQLSTCLARWAAPGGQVESFDPNPSMLATAEQNLRGIPGINLTRGRCEDLDFPAASFDRVVCFRVFPHFDDVDAVLQRFQRWLPPGGRLVIAHWEGREALNAIHAAHGAVQQETFPQRDYLEPALQRRRFVVKQWIDNDAEIFIEATKGS